MFVSTLYEKNPYSIRVSGGVLYSHSIVVVSENLLGKGIQSDKNDCVKYVSYDDFIGADK